MKYLVFLLTAMFLIAGCSHNNKKPKIKKTIDTKVLKGSGKSQIIQNKVAKKEKLSRIRNLAQLKKMIKGGYLVKITSSVDIDDKLEEQFSYVRPWVNDFLDSMAKGFAENFSNRLQVNSAVRTVEYQKSLRKNNSNAAGTSGDKASSHLTGATIDLAKKNLTEEELQWCQSYLINFEKKELIEATEEHNQACFHFMVFKKYSQPKKLTNP